MLLNYIVWNVDPEIFKIFGFSIRWYGLLWASGIWVALMITQRVFKSEGLPDKWLDKLFIYTVVATIVGARLGHCLFYNPAYYLANPLEILNFRQGGLASHGAAVGIIISNWLYHKNVAKRGYIWVFDRLVMGVALAGALIRFGNLMNSEIYGGPTTLPWGFVFVRDGQTEPMHPTQIYEMLYCLITFAIIWILHKKKQALKRTGLIFGVFLVGVFLSRFLIEFIKNDQEAFEQDMIINMGQTLSLPLIIWGIWLIVRSLTQFKTKK